MNAAPGVTHVAAAAAFDHVAHSYDELFTYTAIGRAQREQVWRKLLEVFAAGSRILELNCGTGEDARFLAKNGRSVVACDASAMMIEVATRRAVGVEAGAKVEYLQIANERLNVLSEQKPFDGAFSNFSGLNCVADLKPVAEGLATRVRLGGRVLLCIWSRRCVAEALWYLFHWEPAKAMRRLARRSSARIGYKDIPVYYHSIREVQRLFEPWFRLTSRRAVGLFVPPSYVERAISKREKTLARLEWLDRRCAHWPILRDAGDHVLLEFVRCKP
jgi:ubiquinone/menaquinone biosynthesis C-methylase UbiE